uniref:palmitoyl-CoA hydrolase n=1 Tax=Magallana gigas TaxID=29159 RepID=A0A8W8L241_MAGGI
MRFTEQAMVIKKLMVITGCFIFCATPYIITTFPVLDYNAPVGKKIHMITAVTLLANSAINPILYVWRFREARYHMKRLLCFWNEKYIEQLQRFCAAYKPVVFIHGFNGTPEDGNLIKDIIQKMHPGTLYYTANAFNRTDTVKPLWEEVAIVKPQLVKYMEAHPDGIHLICYSQGGLVCRGLLSTIPDHNVDTLIAVSSPMAGIYGGFKGLPECIRRNLYRLLYSKMGQRNFLGNYWKDPHHLELYEKFSDFLAPLNNDSISPHITGIILN